MHISIRRRRDTFIGIRAFGLEYAGDFPVGSDAAEQFGEIAAVLALIAQYGTEQALGAGNKRFSIHGKGLARRKLGARLEDIATLAGTLALQIAGIERLFRIPKNLTDAGRLALARSFAAQAPDYHAELTRRGLDEDFIEQLEAATEAFEESLTPPAIAQGIRVEATARLAAAVRRGMIARRILKGILKVKYKNDLAKMQAWRSASRLERTAKAAEAAN